MTLEASLLCTLLLILAALRFRQGRRSDRDSAGLQVAILALALSILGLLGLFAVFLPMISRSARGGLFGATAAVLLGLSVTTAMQSAWLLGNAVRQIGSTANRSPEREDRRKWPKNLPAWFNEASHVLNFGLVSILSLSLGFVLVGRSTIQHEFDRMTVVAVTTAVLYLIALGVYVLTERMRSRR